MGVSLPGQRSTAPPVASEDDIAAKEKQGETAENVSDPRGDDAADPADAPAAAVPVEPDVVPAEPDAPPISDNRRRAERTAPLFAELATLEKDDPRRERLREILVEEHLPLVRHFARRFSNRGEPFDDLLQVGTLGLIAAIDRFDPTRGVEFL